MRALILAGCSHFYSDDLRAWWREQTPEAVVPPDRHAQLVAAHTALGNDH